MVRHNKLPKPRMKGFKAIPERIYGSTSSKHYDPTKRGVEYRG